MHLVRKIPHLSYHCESRHAYIPDRSPTHSF